MKNPFLVLLLFLMCAQLFAQEPEEKNWDNNMYTSNKFNFRVKNWRHSGEFQTRYKNNVSELDQWLVEYAATYYPSENWEFVPDLRFTKKPTRTEYRPGFGVIYKNLFRKSQLVQQVKYQYDIKNGETNTQGLRYVLFYNYLYSDKILFSAISGGLFEFSEDFSGFLGFRGGLSAAYIFDKAHTANIGYFYGLINEKTGDYSNIGVLSLQLIININRNYKYTPAKYFSF